MVAGPIGEALLATGIGIAVAIPAVLAFNYFVRRVKSVVADLDDFANDFLNLAQHAVPARRRGARRKCTACSRSCVGAAKGG